MENLPAATSLIALASSLEVILGFLMASEVKQAKVRHLECTGADDGNRLGRGDVIPGVHAGSSDAASKYFSTSCILRDNRLASAHPKLMVWHRATGIGSAIPQVLFRIRNRAYFPLDRGKDRTL